MIVDHDPDHHLWKVVYALRGVKQPTYLWILGATAAIAERKALRFLRKTEGRRCQPTTISIADNGWVDVL